jgi:hypothetical protein
LSHSTTWKTSPKDCLAAINPLTVRDAIQSSSPALGFFVQDSPIKAAAILSLLIIDLVKFFNVGKTMNDQQVAQTIDLILQDQNLRSLKPDDFKLCFNRIKRAEYGKAYDRIDGQNILECLYLYLHERVTECEEMSFKAHQLIKDGKMAKTDPEGQKKVLDALKQALKDADKAPKMKVDKIEFDGKKYKVTKSTVIEGEQVVPVNPSIPKNKGAREKFIQYCFQTFNGWYRKRGFDKGNIRFIKYGDKVLSEVEYVELMVKRFDRTSK